RDLHSLGVERLGDRFVSGMGEGLGRKASKDTQENQQRVEAFHGSFPSVGQTEIERIIVLAARFSPRGKGSESPPNASTPLWEGSPGAPRPVAQPSAGRSTSPTWSAIAGLARFAPGGHEPLPGTARHVVPLPDAARRAKQPGNAELLPRTGQ